MGYNAIINAVKLKAKRKMIKSVLGNEWKKTLCVKCGYKVDSWFNSSFFYCSNCEQLTKHRVIKGDN